MIWIDKKILLEKWYHMHERMDECLVVNIVTFMIGDWCMRSGVWQRLGDAACHCSDFVVVCPGKICNCDGII